MADSDHEIWELIFAALIEAEDLETIADSTDAVFNALRKKGLF